MHQRVQALADTVAQRRRCERFDRRARELQADHRRRFDRRALGRRESVQPRFEQRVDGRRDRDLDAALGAVFVGHPAPVQLVQGTALDQHRQHLLDVQRVALGSAHDARDYPGRQCRTADPVRDDLFGRRIGQGRQHEPARVDLRAPVGQFLDQVVPRGGEDQDRHAAGRGKHVVQQIEEGAFRPVDVVDEDDERLRGRLHFEEAARGPVGLGERVGGGGQPDRAGQALGHRGVADRLVQAAQRKLGWFVVAQVSGRQHHGTQRPEGDAVAVGKAAAGQYARARRDALDHLVHQARLADARITDQRDQAHRPFVDRLAVGGVQCRQFGLAADERLVVAAHHPVLALRRDESPGGDPFGLALRLEWFDGLDLHRVAHQAEGRVAEIDLVLRRRLLEPRCGVHRVAGGELLARARVVVGDHLAGVHAGAHRKRHAVAGLQVLVQFGQGTPHAGGGAHRAKCVVLVRTRQAEDGHDRVADELLDLAAVPHDLGRHRGEPALLQFVQRLGIDPLAQCGGADQVAEDDGHRLAHLVRPGRCGTQRRAAVAAEPELRRVLLAATGAVDHPAESSGECRC